MYNPSLGRFISRDPIGETGGLNLYQAFGGDPINNTDFLGLDMMGVDMFSLDAGGYNGVFRQFALLG